MKKTINDIFDEASAGELESLINQNEAPESSADILSAVKSKVYAKTGLAKRKRSFIYRWQTYAAAAACLALIIGTVLTVPLFNKSEMPTVSLSAPRYYGSRDSIGLQISANIEEPKGISVTAKLAEVLPDTYTVFDEWTQHEFRILRMKTVKLLHGSEITDEFYYLIPAEFMTDFSVFDTFVISNMRQYTYEYYVMYNKTQGKAERLNIPIFGYFNYGFGYPDYIYTFFMARSLMAFDAEGNFDGRLWSANAAWIEGTKGAPVVGTVSEAEESEEKYQLYYDDVYVHLLKDITGGAREALEQIKNFDNGVFVPDLSLKLGLGDNVKFNAVKYINGFATNEDVRLWNHDGQVAYEFTKAHFGENELKALPNLSSAVEYVVSAYERGEVAPPHIANYEQLELRSHAVFGWYAKTTEGFVGVVRVTWRYHSEERDDAYYIIKYGSDECKPIDRDSLLELFGEYETTYIYKGGYDGKGKDEPIVYY